MWRAYQRPSECIYWWLFWLLLPCEVLVLPHLGNDPLCWPAGSVCVSEVWYSREGGREVDEGVPRKSMAH